MACGRITVQLASCMPKCIMLQVRDGQGPSPHFLGLTDGQFPYIIWIAPDADTHSPRTAEPSIHHQTIQRHCIYRILPHQ